MQTSTGTFAGGSGRLFERHWSPEEKTPRAHLIVVHGYAEHAGRYDRLAARLTKRGFAVHAFDLRGHGLSDGERVLVRSFTEYLDDLDSFMTRVQAIASTRPVFLLGHSMGGTIVTLAMLSRRPALSGLLLSGAGLPVDVGVGQKLFGRVLMALGRIAPALRLRTLAAETVSRDPAVVAGYDADPLNYRGRMPAGTLAAMIRALRFIDKHESELSAPVLIMHGTADALTDPVGSRRLYQRAASADKALKVYDGLYHEILNEPEQDDVMGDIAAWIEARLPDETATTSARAAERGR